MTSFRQFQANRRNALRSTGPTTAEGKQRSRLNAVRHGLAAETVVGNLEDADDYKAFEATIIADYCAETAVARELVLRLASLLWRLRRSTAIETRLFAIDAVSVPADETPTTRVPHPFGSFAPEPPFANVSGGFTKEEGNAGTRLNADAFQQADVDFARRTHRLTYSFLRLASLDGGVFELLNRYEAGLWRQAIQIIFALDPTRQR
jgi:hypothetical protein